MILSLNLIKVATVLHNIAFINPIFMQTRQKSKDKRIYIALIFCSTRKALRHGSQSHQQLGLHQCLPLPRKRSPDGASPD